MLLGEYPTPGDVKIYIGAALVDDAYRVDYNEQNNKIPLAGYHQKHFVQVADGKVMVVGNIIIHFRFPGYLTYAIKNVLNQQEQQAFEDAHRGVVLTDLVSRVRRESQKTKVGSRDSVLRAIEEIRRSSVDDRVRALVASHELGFFNQQSALLNSVYGVFEGQESKEAKYDPLQSPVEMAPDTYMGGKASLDLRLYYGYIGGVNQGVYVTEVLRGVHFTGKRKVVNASTSGGDLSSSGQSLLEVYPFFARSVDSVVEDKPPDFLGVS